MWSGRVAASGEEWHFKPNWPIGLEYLDREFDTATATGAAGQRAVAFPPFENDIEANVICDEAQWRA